MVTEGVGEFLDQFGQHAAFVVVRLGNGVHRAVEECVLLPGMPVEVQE